MGSFGSRHLPARSWLRYARDKKPAKARALKIAWAMFLLFGLPSGIMAILGYLAFSGIYFEPVRQFWRPWPPDVAKGILAVTGFATAVAHLCYRQGREKGYKSGKVAGKAVARNVAENLGSVPEPALPPPAPPMETPMVFTEPPVPPPQ